MEKMTAFDLFKMRKVKAETEQTTTAPIEQGFDFLADDENQVEEKQQQNYLEYVKARKTVRDYGIDLEHLIAVEAMRIRESADKKITETEIKDRLNANQEIFKMKKNLSDLKYEAEKLFAVVNTDC